MTLARDSSQDLALSCLLAESNQRVQGEYSGCVTVKLAGSDKTVTSRCVSASAEVAEATAACAAAAAAGGRFESWGAAGAAAVSADMAYMSAE